MEYVNVVNIVTAVVVLLMLNCLRMLFFGDIGRNKAFHIILLVGLAIALYVWRSGVAAEFIKQVTGIMK